jgi:hypothetical protein
LAQVTGQGDNSGFLSQGQGDRFDRWVEFFGALVMSVATVATAWCAYQSSLWGGDESRLYFEAATSQLAAGQAENQARLRANVHVSLFSQYINALAQDNDDLTAFYYQRFPPELKTATDAWLATNPFEDPTAPQTPFEMAEYRLAEQEAASRAGQESKAKFEAALEADEDADNYVLLTVIFATVLFFSGISGKFQWQVIDAGVLAMGVIVLSVGLLFLIQMPVQ